ncbi:MAG: phosphate signaling complex protein PhoU [Pirellulaceae bacterium]
MSTHLTRDLDNLHRDVMTMSVMVEELVKRAVEQLTSPDLDSAKLLAEEDDQIDQWDVRIEETCLKILALHQPVAGDLRRIATVLKISNELERVADLGVDIAERAIGLMKGPVITIPETLPEMMRIAVKMLNQSIDAYVRLDSDLARDVFATDHHVDSLQSQIIAQLLGVMRAQHDFVEPALHLFSATRHIERIADHATNIAEDVIYLVEGAIVRHQHQVMS